MSRIALLLLVSLGGGSFACKRASDADPIDAAPKDAGAAIVDVEDLTPFLTSETGSGAGATSGGASAGAASSNGAPAASESAAPGAAGSGSTTGGAATTTTDPHPTEGGTPAGVVEIFAITASGAVTADPIAALLNKQKNRYRACYGKALAANASTGGTLKLRMSIDADGKVGDVSVIGGTLGLSPLVQCSVAVTKSLKLTPKPTGTTKAGFDLKFSKG